MQQKLKDGKRDKIQTDFGKHIFIQVQINVRNCFRQLKKQMGEKKDTITLCWCIKYVTQDLNKNRTSICLHTINAKWALSLQFDKLETEWP